MTSLPSCLSIERMLCGVWTTVLSTPIGPHDDFFDCGGDSLKVVDVVIAVRDRGIALRSSAVFRHPTPARLAESLTLGRAHPVIAPAALVAAAPTVTRSRPVLTPMSPSGTAEPLFFLRSAHSLAAERKAAVCWAEPRPVYVLASAARAPETTVEAIADQYVADLTRIQQHGSYHLAGVGSGAVVAFEIARKLRADDHKVALLAMIDPALPSEESGGKPVAGEQIQQRQLAQLMGRFGLTQESTGPEILAAFREAGWYEDAVDVTRLPELVRETTAMALAVHHYRPAPYDGSVLLVADANDAETTTRVWDRVIADAQVHWFNHGVRSPLPLLNDPEVTDILRANLEP